MNHEEKLSKLYSTYTDEQIIHIICNPKQYTENALVIAKLEVEKRAIPQDIFDDFKIKEETHNKVKIQMALQELPLDEKAVVYFLWIFKIIFALFLKDAFQAGAELKLKQVQYYWFGAILFTILSSMVASFTDSFIIFFLVFGSGFIVLLKFDYNRRDIFKKYNLEME